MDRLPLLSLILLIAPVALAAQQPTTTPTAPHDTVQGTIRAVDVRARTLEINTGVGFALRIVRLDVPAGVPITDREDGQVDPIGMNELKRGDVVRAVFGGRAARFVAYVIDRVGRMDTGVEPKP